MLLLDPGVEVSPPERMGQAVQPARPFGVTGADGIVTNAVWKTSLITMC